MDFDTRERSCSSCNILSSILRYFCHQN